VLPTKPKEIKLTDYTQMNNEPVADMKYSTNISVKGRDHLGDLGIHRRAILRLIFMKQKVRVWTGFDWLWLWSSGGRRFF
jgi:hypothetical protein